jgi:hypothetical protein
MTFDQAVELASSRNLQIQAARRARAIREGAIRSAQQIPNEQLMRYVLRHLDGEITAFGSSSSALRPQAIVASARARREVAAIIF